MQYKIPVQIENEDKIFLGLSLRQLSIIMIGGGIAYSIFKSVEQNFGGAVALFPSFIIMAIFLVVALFRHTEMTFLPFILNLIRLNLNGSTHVWSKGVDSYGKLEIGYVRPSTASETTKNTKGSTTVIYDNIEDKLSKI